MFLIFKFLKNIRKEIDKTSFNNMRYVVPS